MKKKLNPWLIITSLMLGGLMGGNSIATHYKLVVLPDMVRNARTSVRTSARSGLRKIKDLFES